MRKVFCKFFLWLSGWKIGKPYPKEVKKSVIVAAPHTSNWDYVYCMLILYTLDLNVKFLGKSSLFKFPLGWLIRATGGIPVHRDKKNNLVEYSAQLIKESEEIAFIVPVEGTRSYVQEWRSGFYHIALQANVPIALGYLDYKKKEGGFLNMFYPTGNYEEDLKKIKAFYKNVTAKYPKLSNLHEM